jgi:sugar O-acyltransferase (sialic acid O-acetyltransferase NeuD family)
MMKNLIIIGSGAVAAELTSFFEDKCSESSDHDLSIKGYLDFEENIEKYWKRYDLDMPVLGDVNNYPISENDFFVIAISDVKFRKTIIDIIKSRGGKFINIIHPTSIVARNVKMGEGNIINPYCILGPNVKIGDFNLLTSQSIISHDSLLGNNNILSTALLCGHVKVQDNNSFGIRSSVIPHINIGNFNTIQAGMIVDRDVADDTVVFHRFKEKVLAINHYLDRE